MNKLKRIKAKDPKFELHFVIGFYDHPLTGLAHYDGELVFFERQYRSNFIELFSLSFFEKLKYKVRKAGFEICVGTHNTYDKGKDADFFYWRSPKWIHRILYNYYYYGLNFSKWRNK